MRLRSRIGLYLWAWLGYAVFLAWQLVAKSQQDLALDPSAMAWTGFLPFLFPLFLIWSGIYVGPIALICEAAFFIWVRILAIYLINREKADG